MAFRQTTALLAVGMLSLGAAEQVFAEEKERGTLEQIKNRVSLSGIIEVDVLVERGFCR